MDSILNATLNATAAVRALPRRRRRWRCRRSRCGPRRKAVGAATTEPRLIGLRRLLVIGGATAMSVAAPTRCTACWRSNGPTPLALIMLALFLALFAWIALSFTSALAGFFSLLAGGGRRLLARDLAVPATRTALLMPTYNESPYRVMAGLQAIWESLQAAGQRRRIVRHLHPERHHRARHLDRGGGRLPGLARAHRRQRPHLLSPPPAQHRTQGRQHRRLGRTVRRRVSAVPDPGRRQRDGRRHADPSGERDGTAFRCRADPDAADRHRRHHAVRAPAAVRRPRLWAADRAWHRLVARRGGQLLGPQRADPHAGLRRCRRTAGTALGASRSVA